MRQACPTLLRLLVTLPCLLLASLLTGAPAQALEVQHNRHALSAEIDFLEDAAGSLTLSQLLADPARYRFLPISERQPQGAFTPVWVRLQLNFTAETLEKSYYLFSRVGNLYDIRLYRQDETGRYRETITGNNYPASSRELPAPRHGFLIEPRPGTMTLYLRFVGGPGTASFPWDLVEQGTYHRNADLYYGLDVAGLAAIAALLLFNLCVAITLRSAEYGFYCAYVFSVMMALITVDGLGFYFLWPDFPALNSRALHSFNLLSAAMRLLAIMSFVQLASLAPRLHKLALTILALLAITLLAVNVAGIHRLPPYAATIPWALGILYGFAICGYAIRKKVALALPLFISLIVPSVTAIAQGVITVNGADGGIIELQLAKLGFIVHILLFSLCLAAHIRMETDSRIDALHDSLTGLPGTILLQERFKFAASMARRQGTKLAVMFIDLDGFKAVNDGYGHAAGDQLLAHVAANLQSSLRRTDTVARIGGDEFAVLLTQVREQSAVDKVAPKLVQAASIPCLVEGGQAQVSASIGVAMYPDEGSGLEELLKIADQGMYEAKRSGKNTYRYQPYAATDETSLPLAANRSLVAS